MFVNAKKPLKLQNRTNYFSPSVNRTFVHFSSPDSYRSRKLKIEGYEARLYWQFRYCDEHNGQTFFYTLTYNDESVPHHYGINCFDYEDLRDLFTGGFRKQLLRKYGTTFKYFVGAELGDGKGERGLHNNPHYHILFFLEDAKNDKFPYRLISGKEFRHLVRLYWQGFDEDVDKLNGVFHDYREARYGIACEGEPKDSLVITYGKVIDFRACVYCAKYVCKDCGLRMHEKEVLKSLRTKLWNYYKKHLPIVDASFWKEVIYPLYNIPRNPKSTDWCYSDLDLVKRLLPESCISLHHRELFDGELKDISFYMTDICYHNNLFKQYWRFFKDYVEGEVQKGINVYRNRYCNKCRISHGVGDFALLHCDKSDPVIKVPSKDGFEERTPSLYYYRKLFTDVFVDKSGSVMRVLNNDGIEYKVKRLASQVQRIADQAKSNAELVLNDRNLFDSMRDSDVNTEVFYSFDALKKRYEELCQSTNINEIVNRYAVWKLVYEDRFFSYQDRRDNQPVDFPVIDVERDYRKFLVPSVYSVSRGEHRIDAFFDSGCKGYMPFCEHPYFLRFIGFFTVLDLCADYFFIQKDDKNQAEAEERARVKRFHDINKLKEFYSHFKS